MQPGRFGKDQFPPLWAFLEPDSGLLRVSGISAASRLVLRMSFGRFCRSGRRGLTQADSSKKPRAVARTRFIRTFMSAVRKPLADCQYMSSEP
jgi:hypothetical protein